MLLTNRTDWNKSWLPTRASSKSSRSCAASKMETGWDGVRCLTGPTARSAFTGISLLKYLHKQAQAAWPGLSVEQLFQELRPIQQYVLLYPTQGEKGPPRCHRSDFSLNNSWPKRSA